MKIITGTVIDKIHDYARAIYITDHVDLIYYTQLRTPDILQSAMMQIGRDLIFDLNMNNR
jgi:hypothetical protein